MVIQDAGRDVLCNAASAHSMSPRAHRWLIVALAAATVLLVAGVTASAVGVPKWESALYHWIRAKSADLVGVFGWITMLGSRDVIYPAAVFLLVALPDRHLRRWWLWVAVLLVSSFLVAELKGFIGRPRPEMLRAGFPSGHTTAAVTFFAMAAYLLTDTVRSAWARATLWASAALVALAVGLSRIVIRVHWPLDVVGGAALGLLCMALAAWWSERTTVPAARTADRARLVRAWVYRWRYAFPLPLMAVLFVTPPIEVVENSVLLDAVFDIGGVAIVVAGLTLRAWAIGYTDGLPEPAGHPGVVMSGPYRFVRHAVYIGNFVIALGIVTAAENALGFVIIPAAFFLGYRLLVSVEEDDLRRQFGAAYDDYCQRVPRWIPDPRSILSPGPQRFAWSAAISEYRTAGIALALTALAEASESLPHVLR